MSILSRIGEAIIPQHIFKDARVLYFARIAYFLLSCFLVTAFLWQLYEYFILRDVGVEVKNKWYWRMEVPSVAICPAIAHAAFEPESAAKIVKFSGDRYEEVVANANELQNANVSTNVTIPKRLKKSNAGSKSAGCITLSFVGLDENVKPKVEYNEDHLVRFVVFANLNVVGAVQPMIKFAFYDSMDAEKEPMLPDFNAGLAGMYYHGAISRRMLKFTGDWPWQTTRRNEYQYQYSQFPTSKEICTENGMREGCTMLSYEYNSFFTSESVSAINRASVSSIVYFSVFAANLVNLLNLFNIFFPNVKDEHRRPSPLLVWLTFGFLKADDDENAQQDKSDEEAVREPLLKNERNAEQLASADRRD